jgi:hypothetical protein
MFKIKYIPLYRILTIDRMKSLALKVVKSLFRLVYTAPLMFDNSMGKARMSILKID